uniref:SoHo domain-containing protein n=1 Tax=Glossina austeni TaxID=7395 RepID=A0A1A9US83_GLOAU
MGQESSTNFTEDVRTSYTFSPKFKAKAPCGTGIWSPKNETPSSSFSNLSEIRSEPPTPPPPPSHPVWTPKSSPQVTRKGFRPIQFESPRPSRKFTVENGTEVTQPPWNWRENIEESANSESVNISEFAAKKTRNFSESQLEVKEILSSDITKGSVLEKIQTFEKSSSASDVNKSLDNNHRTIYKPNDVLYNVKHVYMSEPESINECPKKMAQLGRRLCDGIGPVTNDGMPIVLRSEVKEPHQHEWYKRLYQTIHKQKHGGNSIF